MEKQENLSIWKRIVSFIKRIFGINDVLLIDSPKEEEYAVRENTIEELANQYKIISLQKDYESGVIKEEELSDYEKESLMELYKKQVETLEINIAIKKQELLSYKEKILKAKQKLSLNTNE